MTFQFGRAFLVAAAVAFASAAHAADVQYPPGSKVGMTPPKGFSASEGMRGFDDRDNNSAILMLELPAEAFPEISKAMTAEGLKKQGVVFEKKENLTLKSGKAVLIVGRQDTGGEKLRKWILVAGTPDLTAIVTALVPDKTRKIYSDDIMREAFASLDVRASVPIEEQIGLLPFKLDDLANLRAFRVEPNTVFLTEGPKDSSEPTEQPLLVVSAASGGPTDNTQREVFARNLFAGLGGFKDLQIIGTDTIRLSGVQTHQLLAEGKDAKTGADVKLVQWLRFGNGAFVRFLGIARSDSWQDAFPRFRTVRDSLASRQ